MDGLGTKVSAKIRLAIQTKLIKLDAYVDDELPDYIMVMLANHRTKTQMERELGLFLKNNTIAFTNWLYAVIERLKKVTFDEVKNEAKKKQVSKKLMKRRNESKEKSGKYSGTLEKSSVDSRASPKERKGSSPSKPNPSKDMPVSKDNVNMTELVPMMKKRKSSSGELESSSWTEGYNPTSLLKSAFGKTTETKTSRRNSSSRRQPSKRVKEDREEKKESEDRRGRSRGKDDDGKNSCKPKAMKVEVNFYARDSRTRNRSRSRSGSPQRAEVCQFY